MLESWDNHNNYNISRNAKCECLKIVTMLSNQQPMLLLNGEGSQTMYEL